MKVELIEIFNIKSATVLLIKKPDKSICVGDTIEAGNIKYTVKCFNHTPPTLDPSILSVTVY